jgi:hypothetical protein
MEDLLQNVMGLLKTLSESQVYKAATKPFALRLYAFIGLAIITIIAVRYAIKLFTLLHNETRFETLLKELRIPGPRPTREESIQAQLERRMERVQRYISQTTSKISLTMLFGVIVPLSAVLIITLYGNWFFPHSPVLIDRGSGAPILNPSTLQITKFALDLFIKGGLNDFSEGFNWNIGQVSNATSNILFTIFVIGFRIAADLFLFTLLYFLWRTWRNWKAANREALRLAVQTITE